MKPKKMLEFLRKINCLGISDIANMFNDQHFNDKYTKYRESHGPLGNFAFIFELDSGNFERFYEYVLSKFDGVKTNTEKFMLERDMLCPFCQSYKIELLEDTYCCDDCGGSYQVVQEPQDILLEDTKK